MATVVVSLVAASCGSGTRTETSDDAAEAVDEEPRELVITAFSDRTFGLPPIEDFLVQTTLVTFVEEVTAVGEVDDELTLLGSSCATLQAENPEVISCTEETSRSRRTGPSSTIDGFDLNGTLVLPVPEADIEISMGATSTADDLCEWGGFLVVEAGQTEATIELSESCA